MLPTVVASCGVLASRVETAFVSVWMLPVPLPFPLQAVMTWLNVKKHSAMPVPLAVCRNLFVRFTVFVMVCGFTELHLKSDQ